MLQRKVLPLLKLQLNHCKIALHCLLYLVLHLRLHRYAKFFQRGHKGKLVKYYCTTCMYTTTDSTFYIEEI